MPSKYLNVRTTAADGRQFASKAEARRYEELRLLEKAGEVTCIELQPRYALKVTTDDGDKTIGAYVADFAYFSLTHRHGHRYVVEDVKGVKTALYKWKKKHVEAQYGIKVEEITCRNR